MAALQEDWPPSNNVSQVFVFYVHVACSQTATNSA